MKKVVTVLLGLVGVMLVVFNFFLKFKNAPTKVSVIGGADGPTSIFLAGKVVPNLSLMGVIIGVILIVVAIILATNKRK